MPKETTTRLAKRWQLGDETTAAEFVDRYSQRLCELAESQVNQRFQSRINSDAVANSALRTFLRRLRTQQITIDRSGDTWKLLVAITLNKVRRELEFHQAQRRDASRESAVSAKQLENLVVEQPTSEDVAGLMDEVDRLMEMLSPQDAQILAMQLAGESLAEITANTGISRWTVRRALDRIGQQLLQRLRKS